MDPLFIHGSAPTAITTQAINSIVTQDKHLPNELPYLVNRGMKLKVIAIVTKYFTMKPLVCPHGVQKDSFYNRTTSIM